MFKVKNDLWALKDTTNNVKIIVYRLYALGYRLVTDYFNSSNHFKISLESLWKKSTMSDFYYS